MCFCQQARAPSHWPSNNYIQVRNQDAGDRHGTKPAARCPSNRPSPPCARGFAQGAYVPARHVHAIDSGGAHGTSLIMPAWNERGYFGVKVINIFPRTRASRCRACTRPITCTAPAAACRWRRSTATSSRCSAPPARRRWALRTWRRPDAAVLLIGPAASPDCCAQAMRAVRPIRKVLVWNLRAAGAQALAEELRAGVRRGRDRGSGSGGAAGGHCQLRHLVHRAAGMAPAATRHAPGPDRQLQARHDRNRHGLLRRHVRLCTPMKRRPRPATCWPRSRLAF